MISFKQFNKSVKVLLALVIVGFVAGACANIVPPSGGSKDVQKPQVKRVEPGNFSTHFMAKKIVLEFNEFFNLDNPGQQIIISPPMLKQPDYRISGKKLTIVLKDSLLPNTTYNINFGNSIKDFNEGNIQDSFKYVFSTGAKIDAGSCSGRVLHANDNTPVENCNIMLYKQFGDSLVFIQRPYYVGKTNKDGYFMLNNLEQNYYKMVALKDDDYDYFYKPEIEEFAFLDTNIFINDTLETQNILLRSFVESPTKTILLDVLNPQLGLVKFVYNKAISNFKVDADIYSKGDVASINPTKDTISYYYADYTKTKTIFYVTTNNSILDTISKDLFFAKANELKNNKISIVAASPVSLQKNMTISKENNFQDLYKPYTITLSRPFKIIDSTKITIREDSNKTLVKASVFPKKSDPRVLQINYDWKANSNYEIDIEANALQDIFGNTNELMSQLFITESSDNYGTIILQNKIIRANNFYVEVISDKGQIVYQSSMLASDINKTIRITNLVAGNYKIIVIDDRNGNKKWDSGKYLLHQQAEKIYSIGGTTMLKAGWDAEIEINL